MSNSTDWESKYQSGETPWDKGRANPALLDMLDEKPLRGRGLVPGCGVGHDVRALAQHADEVVGIDIAPSAIERALQFNNGRREKFMVADLFNLPAEMRGSFDWVWEHTCFCAIDPSLRPAYVEAVAGALKPGGQLVAIFYLDPGNERPDEGPPFEVSIGQLDMLFIPKFARSREWVPGRTYPGREGREVMRVMTLR